MQTKKYNVFHELILSFYKFNAYESFTKNKGGKTFLFGLIISFIQYLVFIVTVAVGLNIVFNTASDFIDESFPEFLIEDGTLYMDEVIEKDLDGMYFYINTNEKFYLDDLTYFDRSEYKVVVLIDSEKMVFSNDGEMQQLEFSDLSEIEDSITKDKIIGIMPMIKNFILIFCSLSIVVFIALVFWSALWHSLFMLIINAITNAKLTFGELYKISLHICTVNIALIVIEGLLPVEIPFFSLIKFIIFMVYAYFAINAVKQERELASYGNFGGMGSEGFNNDFTQPQGYNNLNNNQSNNYFAEQNNSYTQAYQPQQNTYVQQNNNPPQGSYFAESSDNLQAKPGSEHTYGPKPEYTQYDNQTDSFNNNDENNA